MAGIGIRGRPQSAVACKSTLAGFPAVIVIEGLRRCHWGRRKGETYIIGLPSGTRTASVRRLFPRQRHCKRGSHSHLAGNRDLTAVRLNHPLGDGQTQAAAPHHAGARLVDAIESLEHVG
jgi:hypothetical protein